MNSLSRQPIAVVLFLGVICLAGCSGDSKSNSGRVTVRGKLVDKGKPFSLDPSKVPLPKGATGAPPGVSGAAVFQVVLIVPETEEQFVADTNPDAGTFVVTGINGKGIAPGRYKIAITARYGIAPDAPDYFKGRFSPEKTQILRDIKDGEEITIDISKLDG